MKYYGILVVYNMDISESVSYQFMKQHKEISLIIVDNSDHDFGNREIVDGDGNTYLSMNGNYGLSKAYNTALDWIQENYPEMDGYVILLDDDTSLNKEYLEEVKKVCCDIAVPVVKAKNFIISPCQVKHDIVSRWDGISVLSDFSAINSGMVISLTLFKNYRYDENLFLDFVDHQFMKDMKMKNIQIMNAYLEQSFSGIETLATCDNNIRFRIFKKDSRYFYRNHLFKYMYVVSKRVIRLSISLIKKHNR